MKNQKLTAFFTMILFSFPFFSQSKGAECSREVFDFLQKHHFEPYTQNIVVNGVNDFPYNILIDFPAKTAGEEKTENVIFVFQEESVIKNKNLILQTLELIKGSEFDFDIQAAFLYGEDDSLDSLSYASGGVQSVHGLNSFIEQLDTSTEHFAVIVNLEGDEYSLNTSTTSHTSPSFFTLGFLNLLLKNTKNPAIPKLYVSKLFRSNLLYDRQLAAFFDEGIGCIKVNLAENENSNFLIMQGALKLLKDGIHENQDQHFIIIKLFKRYIRLSEFSIMILIEIIVFACLLYFFLMFFINERKKKIAWSSVKYVWYTVPVSFLICVICFFFGRHSYIPFTFIKSDAARVYMAFTVQISFSVFFATLFFLITLLYNPYFHIKAIDYLIMISCFINQSVFILIDMSLFPLFLTIFLISFFCIGVKNNVIHIILLFLMIFTFIPVAHCATEYTSMAMMKNIISDSKNSILVLSLTLYPLLLVYFRILTGIIRKQKDGKSTVIVGMSFSVFLIAALTVTAAVRTRQINAKEKPPVKITDITENSENLIDFEYSDSLVFDDIVRTVTIRFKENCTLCNVILQSENQIPILYTDNDYTTLTDNSIYFNIPKNPPETLIFSYGCKDELSLMRISACFATQDKNCYNLYRREIYIGE